MDKAVAGGSSSLGELYSKCVQMVNENKISTKNAFDLPLIDHMDDIVGSFMGGPVKIAGMPGADQGQLVRVASGEEAAAENRFHEASCTIEASARIYACRVDCVHTDTYRVLGGLNSADMGEEGEDNEGDEAKGGAAKRRRICGVNTLEKNEDNIIQHHIEADDTSDPMFRRMAMAFDAGGAKGLLLSHLPIAEDMSLVFNGDVPLNRATARAKEIFSGTKQLPADALDAGEPAEARARFADARLCPDVNQFRHHLWGDATGGEGLTAKLDALFGSTHPHSIPTPLRNQPHEQRAAAAAEPVLCLGDEGPMLGDDGMGDDIGMPPEDVDPFGGDMPPPFDAVPGAAAMPGAPPLPLLDAEAPAAAAAAEQGPSCDDVVVFDELFEKFCGGANSHQFTYFDECWAKQAGEKSSKPQFDGVLADAQRDAGASGSADGAIVAASAGGAAEAKEKPAKRPLFDFSGLDKPPKPIETELVHKHQLSERAAQWQLHKDVPPYMIDRITMPSWPTWNKCDFACLGLRPHLMLKLVRKPQPAGDGPHKFSDLFSTVVVENPDAFPWLSGESRSFANSDNRDEDDHVRPEHDMDFGDDGCDDDFDGNGLPAHLDADPQALFLRPEDKVIPSCDKEDFAPGADDAMAAGGMDYEFADQPAVTAEGGITYSRNSKFVDVKLVKKHLWDCISEDIADTKASAAAKNTASSFQGLIDRTLQRLPKAETENLSTAVCFICALHLCNEKDLELMTDASDPLGDFAVVGEC